MSTAFYQYDNEELIGVRTFEKAGQEKPRQCFTWAVNPAHFLWIAHVHPLVKNEYGEVMQRDDFVKNIVIPCEIQRFDALHIPA